MSDRPTPEQIASDALPGCLGRGNWQVLLDALDDHGYVIVHPDDVPRAERGEQWGYNMDLIDGWNDCRDRILRGRP